MGSARVLSLTVGLVLMHAGIAGKATAQRARPESTQRADGARPRTSANSSDDEATDDDDVGDDGAGGAPGELAEGVAGGTSAAPADDIATATDDGAIDNGASGAADSSDAEAAVLAREARPTLHLLSNMERDRARVEVVGAAARTTPATRCPTPCSVDLPAGRYLVTFARAEAAREIDVAGRTVFAQGYGQNSFEMILGAAVATLGAGLLITGFLTDEHTCFDAGAITCPERGPVTLGIGLLSLLVGTGLIIDSFPYVEFTELGGVAPRP